MYCYINTEVINIYDGIFERICISINDNKNSTSLRKIDSHHTYVYVVQTHFYLSINLCKIVFKKCNSTDNNINKKKCQ